MVCLHRLLCHYISIQFGLRSVLTTLAPGVWCLCDSSLLQRCQMSVLIVVLLQVSLCPLQLQPNGSARTLVLPLHKASNNRAAVQLSAQWLKSTKQQSARPQQQQERARAMQQGTRISVLPGSLGKQQPPQVQPPAQPSPEQLPRSVSAFAEPSKAVSWQDKVGWRVQNSDHEQATVLSRIMFLTILQKSTSNVSTVNRGL